MSRPWNHWFHCIGGTYGSWLPGDPRGFRTRHHREHVDGDYRTPPPPGLYETRHAQAHQLMRADAITLPDKDRPLVSLALGNDLLARQVELVELAVGGQHFHLLCRFPLDIDAKRYLGKAKRAASLAMSQAERKRQGTPLWSKGTHLEPITSRAHQLAVVRYIRRHAKEGAAIWSQLRKDDPR